jgi:hypothetical protein
VPLLALLLVACVHRVQVSSDPIGAVVTVDGRILGPAPARVEVPLKGAELTLQIGGYRTFTRHLTWFTPRRLEVRMVAEHGPTGTWTPEDVR